MRTYQFDNKHSLASVLKETAKARPTTTEKFSVEFEMIHRLTQAREGFEPSMAALQRHNPKLYMTTIHALQGVVGRAAAKTLHDRVSQLNLDAETKASLDLP